METTFQKGKVIGALILTILWIVSIMLIKSTLVIDFGAGLLFNLKVAVIILGLLILVFYHILYPSSTETTKLSMTVVLTLIWLSLILFFPFQTWEAAGPESALAGDAGAVGFFTLIGGLGICVLWVRFLADEIFG